MENSLLLELRHALGASLHSEGQSVIERSRIESVFICVHPWLKNLVKDLPKKLTSGVSVGSQALCPPHFRS
jgi:hypothetical protein